MWYIVLGLLAAIYLTLNYVLTGGFFEVYIIRPMLWIILAIVTFIIAHSEGLSILKFKKILRWNLGRTPVHAGLLLGGFQVALLIIVGLFFNFGESPYSFAPTSIITNIFFIGSLLVGTELSRAYIIKKATTSTRRYTTLILLFTTIIYMFILIKPSDFAVLDFSDPQAALEFAGAVIVTALAMNLLASYLSYLGGATAAIGYMGTILAFEWFSPILPDPHWTILAMIGTIAPAIGFVVLQNSIQPFIEKKRKHRFKRKASGHSWTIIAVFTLVMVFFSYGYLGVEPTVIYSGSMRPEFEVGDIVIVDDIKVELIKEGDIIQYVRDNVTILHRVVEISEKDNKIEFITKGDANAKPDSELVVAEQITGKAIFTIPKIGWIQIYVKEFFRALVSPFR
jgi:signal peptidase